LILIACHRALVCRTYRRSAAGERESEATDAPDRLQWLVGQLLEFKSPLPGPPKRVTSRRVPSPRRRDIDPG
jgi:hypothetical protein